MTIDRAGSGYTLVAVAPGFNITKSAAFTVACNANCWTAAAPMPAPLSASGIGVVDGILYVVGGLSRAGGATGTVEAYDPWSRKASLSIPRFSLAVGVLNGILYAGRLYAIGGTDKLGEDTTVVEAYDPTTDTWSTVAPLPLARSSFGTAVADGVVYVI